MHNRSNQNLSMFCWDRVEKTRYVNRQVENPKNIFQNAYTTQTYLYSLFFLLNLLFQLPYGYLLTFSKPLGLEIWSYASSFENHPWICHTTFHQCHILIHIIAFSHLCSVKNPYSLIFQRFWLVANRYRIRVRLPDTSKLPLGDETRLSQT